MRLRDYGPMRPAEAVLCLLLGMSSYAAPNSRTSSTARAIASGDFWSPALSFFRLALSGPRGRRWRSRRREEFVRPSIPIRSQEC